MSEKAFRSYEEALNEQHTRNEARRIRTRVNEARQNPHAAGIRWPFELLQNALDAGPREGRSSVTVRVRRASSTVAFEHDGVPFDSQDLAALLSGGSSKEFESDVTTGRFGTGFLVTHVLAERTRLRGLLSVATGIEQFDLVLDRGGDEDTILANIRACNDSIREATPAEDPDLLASAVFEYPVEDESSLLLGLEKLREALPYLYATRPNLGRVELFMEDDTSESWEPDRPVHEELDSGCLECRTIIVERDGRVASTLRVLRIGEGKEAAASAVMLLEESETGWKVRVPEDGAPRVYREYPLRGSGFIPLSFVLDGKFSPDQERSRLLMNDDDKALLEVALSAAVVGVRHAVSRGWQDAHRLAWAAEPSTGFDPTDTEEREWWKAALGRFASRLAGMPIVEGESELYPAIDPNGAVADFVIPRLTPTSGEDLTTVARMWPLVAAVNNLLPPRRDLAEGWTEIANGWETLGVEPERLTVDVLGKHAGADAERLEQLEVEDDPLTWLAGFLDLVGECWARVDGIDTSLLNGLLPDQRGRLHVPGQLRLDKAIPARLKDICVDVGLDVYSELLLGELEELAQSPDLPFLSQTIATAIPASLTEDELIERAVRLLDTKLPTDKEGKDVPAGVGEASVRLLAYLWDTRGRDAAATATRIPLITTGGRIVRWSADRMMMAPVSSWPASAQPFADAYPSDRLLAKLYASDVDLPTPVVLALAEWGMAFLDPISSNIPVELKDRRLAAISSGDVEGVVVSNERFSQIALLQPEVLNRCQESFTEARALLGLVLCHVAPHDPQWKVQRAVRGRKAREEVEVLVRGALWLADLRFRAWVPVAGEEGRPAKAAANAATLKDLLDPTWLTNNDAAIQLLSEWFGFDELELRLLGTAPDDESRRLVRNELARLVELGGADPQIYSALAAEMETRQQRGRDMDRYRRLGLAVQDAIRGALEAHGLNVRLVDRGFDYEVTDFVQDGATRLEVGPYLVEIKATTTGAAHLTPLQARTSATELARYVLCVVDLRGLAEEELGAEWTAARVMPLTKLLPGIGGQTQQTHRLVEVARSNPVGIRNDSALRYEVPPPVWERGVSIDAWVDSLRRSGEGTQTD